MFFACVSSVIIYAYGGIYLKEELGVTISQVGLLEGLAEGTSYIMKLVAGILSDAFQKRKFLMVVGYGIIIMARYVLAIFSWCGAAVVFARLVERVGNGIQAAPRSALVGDISPSKRIGACYGLKRSLATIGSFMGASVAILIMQWSGGNYKILFWFTAIPASLGFLLLLFRVKEPGRLKKAAVLSVLPSHSPKYKATFSLSKFKLLGPTFGKLMVVNFIFILARMGETFLVIHGRDEFHLAKEYVPTVMMVFNFAWASSSYPIGLIADKMNRYWLLCLGMMCLVLADITLATATTLPAFYTGITLWGIQYGITLNIFLSLINEVVPENLRGTGLGIYFITCATATMIGDTTMGRIAHSFGTTRAAFVASGIVSTIAIMSLIVIMGYKIKQK
jgi:MFS family permease